MKFIQSEFNAICKQLKLSRKNQTLLHNIITDPSTVDYWTVSAENTNTLRQNEKIRNSFSNYCTLTDQRDLTTPKRTEAQIKADEDFVNAEFAKIKVPMVDYSIFLGGVTQCKN